MSILSDYWNKFQVGLFPHLETVVEMPLTRRLEQFVYVLDVIRIEQYVPSPYGQHMGRKELDRRPMARAFIAKALYDLSTTELLIERLHLDSALRRICGFDCRRDIPSTSTFSRAFDRLAKFKLCDRVHKALVLNQVGESIVMHVSRDSTAISAREKPVKRDKPALKTPRKRGRPKKGEEPLAKESTRIEKQLTQTFEQAVAELSRDCNVGSKSDSKGNSYRWTGYKAHIDWADGSFPLSVITTSASVHDSQVAIPLALMTADRVVSFYDLMDAAYDAAPIREMCERLGHVAIIDANCRRGKSVKMEAFRKLRYNERSTAERGNSRLKDEFGFRHLRVRGHAKVHLHLMFGILTLFADQLRNVFSG